MARVGIVTPGSGDLGPEDEYWRMLRQGLQERGWEEGKTIAFEHRHVGSFARLPSAVNEMIALEVDVMLTAGAPAALAAKGATDRIPIVFWADDPVGRGIVASLALPRGNATGIARQGPEMYAKRVELLRQLSAGVSRVAIIDNPVLATPLALRQQRIPHGIEVFDVHIRAAEDLSSGFAVIAQRGADAVLVGDTVTTWLLRTEILEALTKARLPAVFGDVPWLALGGLITYGPNNLVLMRQVVIFIDKILRGAKPGDLPVEQPTKFELVINVKTAKALNLTIPRTVLVRTDAVID
jgi:putative ABC transport system substrate-binding protein